MTINKYKGAHLTPTPVLPKFPEMVTITKTTRKLKPLLDKKFINVEKAIIAIDVIVAEQVIEKGRIKTNKELTALGIGSDIRW